MLENLKNMNKIPCSVGILTFNSEKILRRALESVSEFDEIIVCDGGSTDATLDIAREFNCKIIQQSAEYKNEDNTLKNYSGVRNQCLDVCSFNWFFYIDSDEVVTPELVSEIKEISYKRDIEYYVYNISPRIVLDGKLIKYSSNYPGWQKRFFNKQSGARFIKTVHERIDFDKKKYVEGYLKGNWHYFSTVENIFLRVKKYARIEAVLYKQNISTHFIFRKIETILKAIIKIIFIYLRHGFKDTLPIYVEWSRVMYQLYIIYFLIFNKK